jgi:hypothetical protein
VPDNFLRCPRETRHRCFSITTREFISDLEKARMAEDPTRSINPYAAPATASIEGSDGPVLYVWRGLAYRLATWCLIGVGVLSAITLITTISEYWLNKWLEREIEQPDWLDRVDELDVWCGWAVQLAHFREWIQPGTWSMAVLATTATIILWHARVFYNLRALDNSDMKYGVVMSVAWWFIPPPLGFVLPACALLHIQRRSDPQTLDNPKAPDRTGPWLIVAWVITAWVGFGLTNAYPHDLLDCSVWIIPLGICLFLYYCLCIWIALAAIRRIERLQQARFELIRERREHESA